ncbi:MAG: R3H domain-containing nucleic acid-binding protein [Candidatus Sumerlaeia bacterium]|nr:R3H domain-containing nucleic acid-binding protein [Candidatus Sumerlaeia bacterium]
MKHFDITARSPEQALAKAAKAHGLEAADLEISAEFEPDEVDLAALAKEEAAEPALDTGGEAVLYRVTTGLKPFMARAREVGIGIFECVATNVEVEPVAYGNGILLRVSVGDPSFLIGKGGATLEAFQHLVWRVCAGKDEKFPDVILDIGGYRERRLDRLGDEAVKAAHRALRLRRHIALEAMTPVERKYVHNLLKEVPEITTQSEGSGLDRHIVIMVPDPSRPDILPPRRGDGDREFSPRGEDRGGRGGRERGGERRGGGGGGERRGGGGYGERGAQRGGQRSGSGGGGGRRVGEMRPNEQFDPTRHIDYAGLPKVSREEEDAAYRDQSIEGRKSRLPEWKPPTEEGRDDPTRKMVDELE